MRLDSSSSSLDFAVELGGDGGGTNVVTSTQTCAASPEDEDEKSAKLSERTLSALRKFKARFRLSPQLSCRFVFQLFQASQPNVDKEEVKEKENSVETTEAKVSKEPATPDHVIATQPKTLQSIFEDPNDDFDFEL